MRTFLRHTSRLACLMLSASLVFSVSMTAQAAPELLDRVVAVVDDDIIMESELNQRTALVGDKMRAANADIPDTATLREEVLERMVVESIELQLATRAGILIDDNSVNATMENIAKQNNLSTDAFREALLRDGLSYRSLRAKVKRELTINKLRQGRVGRRIQVSNADIDNYLKSEEGKTTLAPNYRLEHLLVAVQQDASKADVALAKQAAEALYQQLVDGADLATAKSSLKKSSALSGSDVQGGDLGWRKAQQLPTLFANTVLDMNKGDIAKPIRSASGFHVIKVADMKGGAEKRVQQSKTRHILISPNEIRSGEAAKSLIDDIYDRLKNSKADFDEMAKTYSDDPGSAREGGSLGWVNPGAMVPNFEKVMNESAIGALAAPFKTRFGWHILEVTERRQKDMSNEIRRNQARNLIRRRKYQDELAVWLRDIRQNAYVDLRLNKKAANASSKDSNDE